MVDTDYHSYAKYTDWNGIQMDWKVKWEFLDKWIGNKNGMEKCL